MNAGAVVGYNVGGSIRRTHNLQGYQHDVNELAQEHAAEGAELEQADARIAEVEAVHAEHAQENGQQQRGVQVVAVPRRTKIVRKLVFGGILAIPTSTCRALRG